MCVEVDAIEVRPVRVPVVRRPRLWVPPATAVVVRPARLGREVKTGAKVAWRRDALVVPERRAVARWPELRCVGVEALSRRDGAVVLGNPPRLVDRDVLDRLGEVVREDLRRPLVRVDVLRDLVRVLLRNVDLRLERRGDEALERTDAPRERDTEERDLPCL